MDNAVVIKVKAEDDTASGFASARRSSVKLTDQIREDINKSGGPVGKGWGKSIIGGFLSADMVGSITSIMGKGLASAGSAISSIASTPVGAAVGAGIGTAAAGVLAMTLSSALTAGAGLGVIGVGIAATLKNNPGIAAAGQEVGANFMKQLGEAAKANQGPILSALGILRDAGTRVAATLGKAFSDTSGSIVPLVRDIVAGVERFISVVAQVASRAGPALEGLGEMFDSVLSGLSDGFALMVGDGKSAGETLALIGEMIGSTIRNIGAIIGWLTKLADKLGVISAMRKIFGDGKKASDDLAGSTSVMAKEMDAATRAAQGERAAMADLSAELRAQADPVFGIMKAQEDLAKAQKATAKATKEHGKDSKEAKAALRDQALAALSLQGHIGKLGDTFNGKMTPAMRSTLRAAGLTDGAINRLERQFREAKGAGDRFSKNYRASITADARRALRSIYTVQDELREIPRAVTIAMRITGVSNVSAARAAVNKNFAHGGIVGAATGGVRDGLTMVGEHGPELLDLPPGTHVQSNPDSARMAASGGAGGKIEVVLTFDPSRAPEAVKGLMTGLRAEIRGQGGNVQQVLGVAGR